MPTDQFVVVLDDFIFQLLIIFLLSTVTLLYSFISDFNTQIKAHPYYICTDSGPKMQMFCES